MNDSPTMRTMDSCPCFTRMWTSYRESRASTSEMVMPASVSFSSSLMAGSSDGTDQVTWSFTAVTLIGMVTSSHSAPPRPVWP